MSHQQTVKIPISGMDCADCTLHVQHAIAALPGVESVNVFLSSQKAVVRLDPVQVDLPALRKAVEGAGYSVPAPATDWREPSNWFQGAACRLGNDHGALQSVAGPTRLGRGPLRHEKADRIGQHLRRHPCQTAGQRAGAWEAQGEHGRQHAERRLNPVAQPPQKPLDPVGPLLALVVAAVTVQGIEVELLPRHHSDAWEQR